MSETPELCGQPKRDGQPCRAVAAHCRFHNPDRITPADKRADSSDSQRGGTPGRAAALEDTNPKTAANVRRCAELMAEGESVESVAVTLRVSPSTVRGWIAFRPELRALVTELTTTRQRAFVAACAADLEETRQRIMSVVRDDKTPPGVILRGADILVRLMLSVDEHAVVKAQLADLEALAGKDAAPW